MLCIAYTNVHVRCTDKSKLSFYKHQLGLLFYSHDMAESLRPDYNTEYSDNYNRDEYPRYQTRWNTQMRGPTERPSDSRPMTAPYGNTIRRDTTHYHGAPFTGPTQFRTARDPTQFQSETYRSVYRDTVVRKDDRGKYIDPFENIATKSYGRRLMYDPTNPDMMYGSQWSSELADAPNVYSYPTTTELEAEQPWTKDLQWQVEGETGHWPTNQWKEWTDVAQCPPYDGYSDQVEYSTYKVPVPY